jgi:hypothetical protein
MIFPRIGSLMGPIMYVCKYNKVDDILLEIYGNGFSIPGGRCLKWSLINQTTKNTISKVMNNMIF